MNITRTESGDVIQTGGVVRVQHGAPDPEQASPLQPTHQPSRLATGPLRHDGHQVVSLGVTRHLAGAEAPTGSVMATLRHEGGQQTIETEPGNPASRTVIATALREGLIRETWPGHYEDAAPVSAPAREGTGEPLEAPDANADDKPYAYLDAKELGIWQQEVEPLPQAAYDAAVAGAIAVITRGGAAGEFDDFDPVVRQLAEAAGMEPDRARELVEVGAEWHAASLARALQEEGLLSQDSVPSFYESVRGSPKLPQALQELMLLGSTNGFRALALEFKRTEGHQTHETLRKQLAREGFESRVDRDTGDILVQRGSGPWVPLSQLKG